MHISDTHGCHDQIEQRFGPIDADTDIIVHSGDFTNNGTPQELGAFEAWARSLKKRMPQIEIVAIAGNHCVYDGIRRYAQGSLQDPMCLLDGSYLQSHLPSVKLLGAAEGYMSRAGVRIWGAGWVPWWSAEHPGCQPSMDADKKSAKHCMYEQLALQGASEHYFDVVPENVDLLLTHCPPAGILDCLEGGEGSWGASEHLLAALMHPDKRPPKVVCWGHVHENRGVWSRVPQAQTHQWVGGCRYLHRGDGYSQPLFTHPPPPALRCQILSNAALLNHGGMDRAPGQITGRPHYFVGNRDAAGEWQWQVEQTTGPVFFAPVAN